jgi:hypothetical protein
MSSPEATMMIWLGFILELIKESSNFTTFSGLLRVGINIATSDTLASS